MADWVYNKLEIKGNQEDVQEVLDRIKGYDEEEQEDLTIDFNNILPIPVYLDRKFDREISLMASKARGLDGYPYIKGCTMDFPDDLRDPSKLSKDEKILFDKYLRNISKCGVPDIWCWINHNWGTSKNAFDSCIDEINPNVVYFNTAWNAVTDLMVALSKLFQGVELLYTFTDYRAGQAAGVFEIKHGEITKEQFYEENSKEAYDIYFVFCPDEKIEYALYNFPNLKQTYFLWQNIYGVKALGEDYKGELFDPFL
ncbi:MAG: hypothetical protein IAE93_16650 [Ignavibacteria bacterium]|nr:hypothetical protein [Ignavibacteria bacterium]